MARREKAKDVAAEDPGGSLADAISAHLALKQEHGASADDVERERESALAPARRDLDPAADLHSAVDEPSSAASAAESTGTEPTGTEPTGTESEPAQAPITAPPPEPQSNAPEPTPEPNSDPQPEPLAQQPGEVTGSFEFEFGAESDDTPPEPKEQPPAPDVLQQTPEFFEETPEYDRLWFEERSPRDFDF